MLVQPFTFSTSHETACFFFITANLKRKTRSDFHRWNRKKGSQSIYGITVVVVVDYGGLLILFLGLIVDNESISWLL